MKPHTTDAQTAETADIYKVEVLGVKFSFDSGGNTSPAVPVTTNQAIHLYGNLSNVDSAETSCTVAYPVSSLQQGNYSVMCSFFIVSRGVISTAVRAYVLDGHQYTKENLPPRPAIQGQVNISEAYTIAGNPPQPNDSCTDYISLPIDLSAFFHNQKVGNQKVQLYWEYFQPTKQTWVEIGCMNYNINLTIDVPSYPWLNRISWENAMPGPYNAWDVLVNIGCSFVNDLKKNESAVAEICRKISTITLRDKIPLNYGMFVSNYAVEKLSYKNIPEMIVFYGIPFVQLLQKNYGNGMQVDCTDIAHMTMFLANAIGCSVKIFRINPVNGKVKFKYNVVPLGSQVSTPGPVSLDYHDIACIIENGKIVRVYDPCFKFQTGDQELHSAIGIKFEKYLSYLDCEYEITIYSDRCIYFLL